MMYVLGYGGLTYDYYMATLGWNLNLVSLKKLALNSLTYRLDSVHINLIAQQVTNSDIISSYHIIVVYHQHGWMKHVNPSMSDGVSGLKDSAWK
jgi:hypothetical protein